MRKQFLETLTELAEKDNKIIFVTFDVGFSFVEQFKERFPKQYLNAGICEQTGIGLAAGLAQEGLKPYVYTMRNFILLRPLEQLRNDICFANSNVKLFGVQGSAAYRFLGASHNMFPGEEEAILGVLRNIHLATYTPSEESIKDQMLLEYQRSGPAYFGI